MKKSRPGNPNRTWDLTIERGKNYKYFVHDIQYQSGQVFAIFRKHQRITDLSSYAEGLITRPGFLSLKVLANNST